MAASRNAFRAFEKAERALVELRQALEAEDVEFAGNSRWRRMLTMVEDKGGKVTAAEWAEIGRKCGYDARGLGGFYRGANASMRRVKATNERILTPAGRGYLDRHGRLR